MQAYGSFCNILPMGDCLDILGWSNYEVKDVGFNICKNLKMTPYIHKLTAHTNLTSD